MIILDIPTKTGATANIHMNSCITFTSMSFRTVCIYLSLKQKFFTTYSCATVQNSEVPENPTV